jgi:hypothetical protein
MVDLSEIKKCRFLYLSKIYDLAGGSSATAFNMNDIGKALGFDANLIRNVVKYLMDEGLIEAFALGGAIRLTHWGLKEVEQAYEHPTESTEHFAPIVNYNINITSSGYGNIINTGNKNTINITNTSSFNAVESKTKDIIKVIQEDLTLTDQIRTDAINVFTELIQEVQTGKPSVSILDKIFMYGGSIGSIGSLVVSLIQLISK